MSSRTLARENAFKCLYELEFQGEINEDRFDVFFETHEITADKVKGYIKDVISGVESNKQDIIDVISKNLVESWKYERLSKINKVLLKLAIYEMVYVKIDFKIIIDEVVELAKKYGEDSSPNFVNGVLAGVVKKFDLKC